MERSHSLFLVMQRHGNRRVCVGQVEVTWWDNNPTSLKEVLTKWLWERGIINPRRGLYSLRRSA